MLEPVFIFCAITVVTQGLFYRPSYELTPDPSQFTFQTDQPDKRWEGRQRK